MRRFRLRRLWRVNCEALMIASGQNLKRVLQKRGWGRRPFPTEAVALVPPLSSRTEELLEKRTRSIPTRKAAAVLMTTYSPERGRLRSLLCRSTFDTIGFPLLSICFCILFFSLFLSSQHSRRFLAQTFLQTQQGLFQQAASFSVTNSARSRSCITSSIPFPQGAVCVYFRYLVLGRRGESLLLPDAACVTFCFTRFRTTRSP